MPSYEKLNWHAISHTNGSNKRKQAKHLIHEVLMTGHLIDNVGGYSHNYYFLWSIQGHAAGQGMGFVPSALKKVYRV